VKIAILGGGGFRVPMIFEALLEREALPKVDELCLYDIDPQRLERIGAVLTAIARAAQRPLHFRCSTRLDDAIEGAEYIFCAIRVGQLEGRIIDERVPLTEGVLGQETTGPGGICFALRTVPVMVQIAETVARLAPRAWFINFTNPAGLVTEAIQDILGDRAIGICDSPAGLCRRVARALARNPEELWFDYFGLNHLGWLRSVHDADGDLLPGLLADDACLNSFEEGRLFGGEWLRSLGMIPNEYLYYYYYSSDTVGAVRSRLQARAEEIVDQQRVFYSAPNGDPDAALTLWRAARRQREETYFAEARTAAGVVNHNGRAGDASGYEEEALDVVEAIVRNRNRVLILNTANSSSMPFLDERAVVEVPCLTGQWGVVPTAVGSVPDHARALIETIKAVERTTIRAALSGSRTVAIQAIAMHPLVPSVRVAQRIFDGYSAAHPDLLRSPR
jgi:6-phospho-beta-glucosidase